MADKYSPDYNCGRDYFKEAVCIDAMRVYDSCSDKDCLEDMRVYVPQEQQQLVDSAKDVRIRNVDVISLYSDMQELPFNKGYYTVELTYYFDVCLELSGGPCTQYIPVSGIAAFTKKFVMFGSEGGVRTFYPNANSCGQDSGVPSEPRLSVQVADPVPLGAKLCETHHIHHECCSGTFENLPDHFRGRYGPIDPSHHCGKGIFVTIGLFSIMQMIRNVQMLIPAYDFCIPSKECSGGGTDDPCELFSNIDFPTEAFFPPKANDDNCNPGCCPKNCS